MSNVNVNLQTINIYHVLLNVELSIFISRSVMMALTSPCGILSDEEECGAVFESTAADVVGLMRSQRFLSPLPEISVINPAADSLTPNKEV